MRLFGRHETTGSRKKLGPEIVGVRSKALLVSSKVEPARSGVWSPVHTPNEAVMTLCVAGVPAYRMRVRAYRMVPLRSVCAITLLAFLLSMILGFLTSTT